MTHTGYAKPRMFRHPRGPYSTTWQLRAQSPTYPLIGFSRLQGHSGTLRPGWEPGHSLGFFPYSAVIAQTRHMRFRPHRFPLLGFLNPPAGHASSRCAGLFHPAGTHRVTPSKFDLEVTVIRFPYPDSFAVTRPSWLPSAIRPMFPLSTPRRVPLSRDDLGYPPLVSLRRPASTVSLGQPWSFAPTSRHHRLRSGFTRNAP